MTDDVLFSPLNSAVRFRSRDEVGATSSSVQFGRFKLLWAVASEITRHPGL
jgi:hypothetical protein